jgi:hypothetical protein
MVKVLMIMQLIALCTPCIELYVSVSYLHICDRPTEQGLEWPSEQAHAEDFTNLDWNQGKPQCIS